ncbi:hypothetical protein RRG08_065476 [Elysia crispata]|uniref:Uncharacterized protein n=1 Tax=Elysia crispata TaxID=231223 RepID=A0AAE1E2F2_9GAST|nr:hypothetical protein RRG08_065476 [Elysia crispata]
MPDPSRNSVSWEVSTPFNMLSSPYLVYSEAPMSNSLSSLVSPAPQLITDLTLHKTNRGLRAAAEVFPKSRVASLDPARTRNALCERSDFTWSMRRVATNCAILTRR